MAKHADVGISALYTRYGSKEELLRKLCTDGLLIVIEQAENAIDQVRRGQDHWQVLAGFMRTMVDADTSSMTLALAGRFAPTPKMFVLANRSGEVMGELFGLVRDALRPDAVLHDISLAFELVAAVKLATPDRTAELRHRYLALVLDGLRAGNDLSCPDRRPAGPTSATAGPPALTTPAPGPGPPLPLVHGLHPGDRDGPPLLHRHRPDPRAVRRRQDQSVPANPVMRFALASDAR